MTHFCICCAFQVEEGAMVVTKVVTSVKPDAEAVVSEPQGESLVTLEARHLHLNFCAARSC